MTADGLLLWMSARGSGSWKQFRDAVEDLHLASDDDPAALETEGTDTLPLYQLLRLNFERVGHAEFFGGAGAADWRIVPPALAISGAAGESSAVVTGARSPRRLGRIREAFGDKLEAINIDGYPTHFIAHGRAKELADCGERAGLLLQWDAPLSILLSIPAVESLLVRSCIDLPFGGGWIVERFSTSTLNWKSSTRDEAEATAMGLFRFSFRHERRAFLCVRGHAREVAAQSGKYFVLRRAKRRVLQYDAAARVVTVPPICRPPLLVERALILSAGLPPTYDSSNGYLRYAGVPPTIAEVATQLLRQDAR